MNKFKIIDRIEVRDQNGDLLLCTNNNLNDEQKAGLLDGSYKCAFDAAMDYELQRLAASIYSYYSHVSIGISGASGTVYTLTDLVSPVMNRVSAAKSLSTVVVENDTANFSATFTPTSDYVICETGVHSAASGGYMGYRQVICTINALSGVPFTINWVITIARA